MIKKTQKKVLEWAKQRDLLTKATPEKQWAKLISEIGELADGLLQNDKELIKDAIGDICVVLTIYCHLQNEDINNYIVQSTKRPPMKGDNFDLLSRLLNYASSCFVLDLSTFSFCTTLLSICDNNELCIIDCYESAYNEIKDRQGTIINGTFVKKT